MNLHTFKDVFSRKKSSLINDAEVDDDDDDDEGLAAGEVNEEIEGEVEASEERFNDAGEVLEPFNLKEERERGKFDSNFNFVFEKENSEVDVWVSELDESAMERAIGEAAVALRRRRELDASRGEQAELRRAKGSFLELCLQLLGLMQTGETLARTIKRIKAEDAREDAKESKKSRVTRSSPRVELAADLADQLVSHGLIGVYDMQQEALEASVSLWEYQAIDGAVHGPYPFSSILEWRQQGYFAGASAVPMRRVLDVSKKSRIELDRETGQDLSDGESEDEAENGRTGSSRKRVRFEDKKARADLTEGINDLMNDLEDADDEVDDQILSHKRDQVKSKPIARIVNTKALMKLACSTGSFDATGRGPWVMSDEAIGYAPEDEDDSEEDVANIA